MIDGQDSVVVALDYPSAKGALNLAEQLDPKNCRLKVGKELFTREGPAVVEKLRNKGFDIFLDLKFHDIPNTTAAACAAAADLGVWMINVHALGGRRMMEAARNAVDMSSQQPLLIGVTILTSMAADDLLDIGLTDQPANEVARLAGLVKNSGLDGLVCSAHETTAMRSRFGSGFVLVTPGIRPAGFEKDDQKRTMTPTEALNAGASYLVIGRPISRAKNPVEVLKNIIAEINLDIAE